MAEQRKMTSRGARSVCSLLFGVLLGLTVLFVFGAIGSLLVAKGIVALDRLNGMALAALFCGGAVSGTVTARRGKRLPLLKSVGVAAALAALCVLCGMAFYDEFVLDVQAKRVAAALLGGICGGILAAL